MTNSQIAKISDLGLKSDFPNSEKFGDISMHVYSLSIAQSDRKTNEV